MNGKTREILTAQLDYQRRHAEGRERDAATYQRHADTYRRTAEAHWKQVRDIERVLAVLDAVFGTDGQADGESAAGQGGLVVENLNIHNHHPAA